MLVKDQPNFFQLGRSLLELNVNVPVRVCRAIYSFCCPCLPQNTAGVSQKKYKVSKGIFALDAEGDMYPDEFTHRVSPADYTLEDENPKISSNKKAPANLLIIENIQNGGINSPV
jgi:hypothetical protein